MLERFLKWWITHLFPTHLRRMFGGGALYRVHQGEAGLMGSWDGVTEHALSDAKTRKRLPRQIKRRNARVALRVPAERAVVQRKVLPAQAARDIDSTLRLALPTLIPFEPAELFWRYEVTARDAAAQKITVSTTLLPQPAIAAEAQAMAELGLNIDAIEMSSGGPLLLPAAMAAKPKRPLGWRMLQAGVACAVIAGALLVAGWEHRMRSSAEAAEARAASLRQSLRAREGTTAGDKAESPAARFAYDRFQQQMSATEVLAALTEALPDDTVATRILLRDGILDISGQAPDAALMVPRLADVAGFAAPSFSSPMRADPDTGKQAFGLRLKLEIAP